jgi:hypothetical protein
MNDTYISLGTAHQVRGGEYFLAYNANVRMIAVLRITSVQERMSVVETVVQMASLRKGDKVKRISASQALALKRQLQILDANTPPLGAEVIVEPDLLAASKGIGFKPSSLAPAPPAPAGPDLSDVILIARATASGVALSWPAPVRSAAGITGYLILRTTNPAELGARLTQQPMPALNYEDHAPLPETAAIYRILAVGNDGATSAQAPSIEVTYTAPAKKFLGKSPAQLKARNLPIYSLALPALRPQPAMPGAMAAPTPPLRAPGPASVAPTPQVPIPPPIPAAPAAAPVPAPPVPAPSPSSVTPVPQVPIPPPIPTAPAMPPVPTPPVPAPPPSGTPAAAPMPANPATTQVAYVPPAPEKLAVAIEGSVAVVKWNPIASKVALAGYVVYRALPGDEKGAPLAGSPTSDTIYWDRTIQEGKTYLYWVTAQTVEGQQSPPSNKFKVDVPKSGAVPFF